MHRTDIIESIRVFMDYLKSFGHWRTGCCAVVQRHLFKYKYLIKKLYGSAMDLFARVKG